VPPTGPAVFFHRNDGGGVRTSVLDDFGSGSKKTIMSRDIIRRYGHNPILTKTDIPYSVETVHNAAVVKHENA
jgi:hypothetical protein